jgi:hypothetical protein
MTNILGHAQELNADKIPAWIDANGGKIISTRTAQFIDYTSKTQFYVQDEQGKRWHLVPVSDATLKGKFGASRAPYYWVNA